MKQVLMLLSNAFISDPRVMNEARALVQEGYDVTLYCWDRGEQVAPTQVREGIKIQRFDVRSEHAAGTGQIAPLLQLWAKWFWKGWFQRFDIVHCHDLDTLPVGWLLARLKGKKVIFDSHEVHSEMLSSALPKFLLRMIKGMERFFSRRVDAVILPSEFFLKFYDYLSDQGLNIVGNWKDPSWYRIPKERLRALRSEIGIGDRLVISYISNLGAERRIEPLLEAVAGQPLDLFLIIGGSGSQSKLVERYAGQYPNIRYLGFVSEEDRMREMTALSDVIYYGIEMEGNWADINSPNKMFEAIAAGKVFMSYDRGEPGYLIREYGIGAVLREQSAEEIASVLLDLRLHPEKRSIIERAALRLAHEKYNWNFAKQKLLDIYRRLLPSQ